MNRNCEKTSWKMPCFMIPLAFALVELYGFTFLREPSDGLWPLAFGGLWVVCLTGFVRLLPRKAGRITFGILYFLAVGYTAAQTGYFILFKEMMWISDFRYASEGSAFFDVLLQYPISWWLILVGLIALGVLLIIKFPKRKPGVAVPIVAAVLMVCSICGMIFLPEAVFVNDKSVQYAGSDYGRAQSQKAAYTNMFNTHRLYRICGVYQTAVKDIVRNYIEPMLPSAAAAKQEAKAEIDAYFDAREETGDNEMTGIFEGKNVIFVLMESMDDWVLGEHTPTINRLMAEGINFTDFYTPAYGSVRTFNTEFCANTGSFLSSQGGYAFDYVTNDFRQSLASQLTDRGYSAKVYHYNSPNFYSRGVFSPAMGYEEYVCYEDYVTEGNKKDLYDDQFLFDNEEISQDFFRDGQKLNFIITRSAHLSYKYNEVLSHWALKKYPQYRGMTGHEELDCMYVKARLVDDLFARLIGELEESGELENTVIVAYTDHYTYGFKDEDVLYAQSNVEDALLLEKTPFFIWSADGPTMEVTKTCNTSDILPTVLNLLGVKSPYDYIGQDAFDESYVGYALFPNGSWVSNGVAYSTFSGLMVLDWDKEVTDQYLEEMHYLVEDYVRINNLILQSDYYAD